MWLLIAAVAIADAVNEITYLAKGEHPAQQGNSAESHKAYWRDKHISIFGAAAGAGIGAGVGAAIGPAVGASAGGAAGAAGGTTGGVATTAGTTAGTVAGTAPSTVAPTVSSTLPSVATGTLATPASTTLTQAGTAGLTGLESASSSATGISTQVSGPALGEASTSSIAEGVKEIGTAGIEKAIGSAGEQSLEQGIKSLGTRSLFGTIQETIPNSGSFLQKATTGNAYIDAFKNIGRESFAQSIKEAAPNMISRGLQNTAAGAVRGAISDREDPARGALAGGASGLVSTAASGITRSFIPTHPGNYLLPEKSDSLMGKFGTQPVGGPHISTYGDRLPDTAGKIAGGFTKNVIKQNMTPGLRRPDEFPYTQNPYYRRYAYDYA